MRNFIDKIISIVALLVLAPVILTIFVFSLIILGRPVLFRQQRPGLLGKPFILYKFRTMLCEVDSNGEELQDAERMTRYGQFLRSSSLDELPTLFNVARGDMSLIGPRPLLMEYLKLYSPEQARRHDVKPGITGWAQVNGRNSVSWKNKLMLDVWYVDNRSVTVDIKIVVSTFNKVIKRDGISAKDHVTIEKFTGSDSK